MIYFFLLMSLFGCDGDKEVLLKYSFSLPYYEVLRFCGKILISKRHRIFHYSQKSRCAMGYFLSSKFELSRNIHIKITYLELLRSSEGSNQSRFERISKGNLLRFCISCFTCRNKKRCVAANKGHA